MRRNLWFSSIGLALAFVVMPATSMANSPHATRSAAVSATPGFTGAMQVAKTGTAKPTMLTGSQFTGNMATMANADGRLEQFVQTANWMIYHRWQNSVNGGWSGWSYFGSSVAMPALGRNSDGRLEVFATNPKNGLIWHSWQNTAGGSWSSWKQFSWVTLDEGNMGLAVVTNKDGRMEIFAPIKGGGNVSVWHSWQTTSNGTWSGWSFLAQMNLHNLSVMMDQNGQLELFGLSYDKPSTTGYPLYQMMQNGMNGSWGAPSLFGATISSFAVSMNTDGHLEMVATGWYNASWQILHTWEVGANGSWLMWSTFGLMINGWVVGGKNQNGTLEDFVYSSASSQVWHNWQTTAGSMWNGWKPFAYSSFMSLSVNWNADGRQELYATDSSGNLWQDWQTTPNGMWYGWVNMGHP